MPGCCCQHVIAGQASQARPLFPATATGQPAFSSVAPADCILFHVSDTDERLMTLILLSIYWDDAAVLFFIIIITINHAVTLPPPSPPLPPPPWRHYPDHDDAADWFIDDDDVPIFITLIYAFQRHHYNIIDDEPLPTASPAAVAAITPFSRRHAFSRHSRHAHYHAITIIIPSRLSIGIDVAFSTPDFPFHAVSRHDWYYYDYRRHLRAIILLLMLLLMPPPIDFQKYARAAPIRRLISIARRYRWWDETFSRYATTPRHHAIEIDFRW